ncbi:MAG: hypothetical protein ACXW34_09370, partial [Nitrospira sp.]
MVAIGLLWLTLVAPAQAGDLTPLCRFGIAGHQNLTDYPFEALRFGWYADWTATANPVRPGGIEYLPMV